MNNKQIETFKELLADPNFKGKKTLENLLWYNTTEPKFKVGDCFKITDHEQYICGCPVINFNAVIVECFARKTENKWFYLMEMDIEYKGKHTTSLACMAENYLVIRCDSNKNILDE